MISVNIITRADIEKMIQESEAKMREEFYNVLNRLNGKIIDINDIIRILRPREDQESIITNKQSGQTVETREE